MLIGVAIYAKVFATPGEFADLRLDSLSTLFYVANWHFIASGGNYFNLTAQPSPLAHMWSLSIEEQFYIVWPPVALLMLHLGRRLRPSRRLWPLLATAVGGAVASALDMRLSYQHGASVMRLYEGTDTRSQDILVGAALAVAMSLWAEHRTAVPAGGTRRFERFVRAHPAAGTTGVEPPAPLTDETIVDGGVRASSPSWPGRSARCRSGSSSRCSAGVPWAVPSCCGPS